MTYEHSDSRPVANFHLQQLAYLREVERAGTFTEAAARLHVSQSALSQSLAELERRLGVPLFERAGRRRALTETGREVARFAQEVLGRTAELQDRLAAQRRGATGTLSVGMIDAASLYLLPQTIRAFTEQHPGVELRLLVDTSAALLERLHAFELDVAFAVGPLPAGLATVEVMREPLYVYAPADAFEPPDAAAWALYPPGSQTRQLIDEALLLEGIRPRVALESSNPQILRQVVALALAWSILPAGVAEAGEPPLRRQRPAAFVERTLLAARRRSAPPDARVEALLALASSAATSTPLTAATA